MEISLVWIGVMLTLFGYFFNKYFVSNNYWQDRNIPIISGALPFVGHAVKMFWSYNSSTRFFTDMYAENRGRSMVGYYQVRKPMLILRDPELIKTVLISDFKKFHEHVFSVDAESDPLMAENPFFNSDEKWKTVRNRLAYGLMSSKRLQILLNPITEVCKKFTNYLTERVEKSDGGECEIETKRLGNMFTGEVVASAGFGIEGDFFSGGRGPNSFREAIEGFMEPGGVINGITQNILFFFPFLRKILGISLLPKKIDRFFRRVIHEMIVLREKDGTIRNDFLQLMLDKSKSDETTEIDEFAITASATSFFLDGYETAGITLGFLLHHVAENPEIQEKLRHEVRTVLDRYNGEIKYEALGEMTYMDQAFNESLRLDPALGFMLKKCNEPYRLVGNDGLECLVEPGVQLVIPIRAIHRDPEYWPNPDIFQPERFTEEAKKERPKMSFLPFSEGPRICVGMRIGTLQIKSALATILKDFSIRVSPKTKVPFEYNAGSIFTSVKGGMWVYLKRL